ncbi:peroxidase 44-like [Oryza glaberrima]|nr:peroxidase 44-like [Oryza glaberrima]
MRRRHAGVLLILQLQIAVAACCCWGLEVGYYGATCPDADAIVRRVMERRFYNDNTIAPAIIRMLFHDCFVTGCDASLLIVPTPTRPSPERVAIPNQTLRAFNIVNAVKSALEASCPGVVSCADALALMARDSVALLGGAAYDVALGRRDALHSNSWEVDLPAPFSSLDDTLRHFAAKGFTADETVLLFGAHTVGAAHCSSFRYRLARPDDGTMDESLRCDMVGVCGLADQPAAADDAMTFLDPVTPFAVDNAYYAQLMSNRSLLQVDQEAATHAATAGYVAYYAANPDAFLQRFSEVMAKLGTVGVLEGDAGEVRTVCTKYNTS